MSVVLLCQQSPIKCFYFTFNRVHTDQLLSQLGRKKHLITFQPAIICTELQIKICISTLNSDISLISKAISMFDHSFESSWLDDSNELSNIKIG